MKKTNKLKLEEFIRVDHAGERGAIKIYEGQLLALETLVKDDNLKKTIQEMKTHEKEHCDYFENEIKKRNIKPTKLMPLWDLLGVGLGFSSTLLGKKAAMLCTASVEEVIDKHYQNQIDNIGEDEIELRNKIIKFRGHDCDAHITRIKITLNCFYFVHIVLSLFLVKTLERQTMSLRLFG